MAFIHHTDTANYYSTSQAGAIVRAIYRYHTQTLGYCDIAYNFLIDKYGTIYEGRNGGITHNVIGAHTGGYNYESVGIALMGNFSTAKPTSAMLTSLTKLLAWRLDIAHVPAVGTVTMTTGTGNDHRAPGTLVTFNRVAGHRDASYTNCPGNYVYNDLSWIRSRAQSIGLPKIYLPAQNDANLRPDGDSYDEMVRFTSGFSTTVKWSLTFRDPRGVIRRSLTGSGSTAMKVYWNGRDASGAFVPTGLYTWTLNAVDSYGHSATPATGTLNVVTSHPNGTVLQDGTGRYVLEGGAARPIDAITYASNFGAKPVVLTGPNERARYSTGLNYGLREGTLFVDKSTLSNPTPDYYVWSDSTLHKISSTSFTALHYNSAAAIQADSSYLNGLPTDHPVRDITSTTDHPDGTAIKYQDPVTKIWHYYEIVNGQLAQATLLALSSWYRPNEILLAAPDDLLLSAGSAIAVRDGTFIKATDGGAPWLVSDGTKHRFVSAAFAAAMGYTSQMMLTASSSDIGAIPTGALIG